MQDYTLTTARLGMRSWMESDLIRYIEMNQDPRVMEFFPRNFSPKESEASLRLFNEHFNEHGFTYFATDRLDTQQFIGFIGIKYQTYESDFTPCVDIGWRLHPDAWGVGFATEGAKACLEFGFQEKRLGEIYSVAPKLNQRSIAVMRKIGMQYVKDFDHPKIEETSPLRRCELYKSVAHSSS